MNYAGGGGVSKPARGAITINFTADEVTEILGDEISRRHPELVGRAILIAAKKRGNEFTGIDVHVDPAEGV